MEVSDFLFITKCVWGMGMLRVIFNIEAGNYYSKSTFIMTLIKQEKLVFILVILYIREYLCFYKIVYGYPGIHRFLISGTRFPKTHSLNLI